MDIKKARKGILLLVIVIAVAAGIYFFRHGRKEETGVLHLYGNIDIRQIQLAFHDTGRIQRLLVDEGDQVRSGQLLGIMDPSRYDAAVKQLKAEMDAQSWIVARLHAGSRPQEILEAKARVRADQAMVTDARITYQRIKALAETEYVPRQKLDDAKARLAAARGKLDADKQLLDLLVIGPRKEDIAAAEAKLSALTAALDLARQKLADTKLYAPADGIIRNRILEPGDMAFPGSPVFTVALYDPMWVRAYVPEPDLGKIALGMKATITTDSYPGKSYKGWIGFISPVAEFTPKNVETPELRTRLVYQVRVYVCNHRNELRLGMPATVTIRLDQPKPKSGEEVSAQTYCQDE